MLQCLQYCATMSIWLTLGGKLAFTSNISSLMNGLSERPILNVGRMELFVPSMITEPGDHNLTFFGYPYQFFRWKIFEFLGVWVPPFHCRYDFCITNE